jgi:NADH dehydrogenase FAD-containing subunit
MPNIIAKEKFLLQHNIIPVVGVCGAGASGIELAFAFKNRWTKLFKRQI